MSDSENIFTEGRFTKADRFNEAVEFYCLKKQISPTTCSAIIQKFSVPNKQSIGEIIESVKVVEKLYAPMELMVNGEILDKPVGLGPVSKKVLKEILGLAKDIPEGENPKIETTGIAKNSFFNEALDEFSPNLQGKSSKDFKSYSSANYIIYNILPRCTVEEAFKRMSTFHKQLYIDGQRVEKIHPKSIRAISGLFEEAGLGSMHVGNKPAADAMPNAAPDRPNEEKSAGNTVTSDYNPDDPTNLIVPVREGEMKTKFEDALALQRMREGRNNPRRK